MVKSKAKGSAWERRVKKYFEEKHQAYVIKSGGSYGYADLLVIYRSASGLSHQIWAVQCKTNRKLFSMKEEIEFVKFCKNYNIEPFLAYPRWAPYSNKIDNFVLLSLPSEKTYQKNRKLFKSLNDTRPKGVSLNTKASLKGKGG